MKKIHLLLFVLASFIWLLDQASKLLITRSLHLLEIIPVTSFFNIVYYRNIGSAFGLFGSLGNSFFITISFFAVAVVCVMIFKDPENRLAFSFILGGAAGNLTDRLLHGYVIDFIEVHAGKHFWPAFNIADSALTVGMGLLLLNAWLHWRQGSSKEPA